MGGAVAARERGERVVFVSGCFDLLHGGHLEFFSQARALGDWLVVSFAGDASLAFHKADRRSSLPAEHKQALLQSLRMVDEVVVSNSTRVRGLDFEEHFLRIRPAILVVTEDDRYGEVKRQLCARVGASYLVLSKTLESLVQPVSTSSMLASIRAPSRVPLRVDFAGGWLDCPKHARAGACIVNCAVSPLVSLTDWPFEQGGGLGGSGAWALLTGRDGVEAELGLGVGWQDPAVIRETGLCVWKSGARPALEFKVCAEFLRGCMALLWTGAPHCTPDQTDRPRGYAAIERAGHAARRAVLPGQQSVTELAGAVAMSYAVQLQEGMTELPCHGELAKKYAGGGHGGYALYLFAHERQRAEFLRLPGSHAIEPHTAT